MAGAVRRLARCYGYQALRYFPQIKLADCAATFSITPATASRSKRFVDPEPAPSELVSTARPVGPGGIVVTEFHSRPVDDLVAALASAVAEQVPRLRGTEPSFAIYLEPWLPVVLSYLPMFAAPST